MRGILATDRNAVAIWKLKPATGQSIGNLAVLLKKVLRIELCDVTLIYFPSTKLERTCCLCPIDIFSFTNVQFDRKYTRFTRQNTIFVGMPQEKSYNRPIVLPAAAIFSCTCM